MVTPEFITTHWPLTNVRIEKLLQQSGSRSTHLISTAEGKFVVKISDSSKTKTDIERDTFVFGFLRDQEFKHIPGLLAATNGDRYIQLENQLAVVLEYIEGKNPPSTTSTWQQLGIITAKLHQIQNYPLETMFTVANERPLFLDTTSKYPFQIEYEQLAQQLPDFTDLPQRLIHTDIGPHNAVQKINNEIILVDWDDAGIGARILDLGYPLICQFISLDLEIKTELAQAFYQTYQQHESLTTGEREQLFNAGLFFALMYLKYGDIEKNWQRIQFAIKNKSQLTQLF